MNWILTKEKLPPENLIVDTKIDDEYGIRNEQKLVYCNNRWFLPDFSMYVYYKPTHWKISNKNGDDIVEMRDFVEWCRECNPRAEPDRAAMLLGYAVQLGEAILKNREKSNREKDKTEQLLEHSEKILNALIRLGENKIAPPKKSSKKADKSKVVRKKYGEYKHVLLSDEEHARLVAEYGETTVKQYVQAVDEYVQQHGKTYKDYNLTIRRFIRTDKANSAAEQGEHSYDLDKFMEHAMNSTPTIRKEDET
ncbi:MAG: hypothetical protein NC253_03040 [Ruminococcus sp.]|nr:hypothetical protein [Ruminococcus sp.]MCM1380371.1 hypothetical protein [Muribaculaceae bacterium]MCM1478319.1 hypothetical protein [Muribaculaceae bacterium]